VEGYSRKLQWDAHPGRGKLVPFYRRLAIRPVRLHDESLCSDTSDSYVGFENQGRQHHRDRPTGAIEHQNEKRLLPSIPILKHQFSLTCEMNSCSFHRPQRQRIRRAKGLLKSLKTKEIH
jgi:hypothetical protein